MTDFVRYELEDGSAIYFESAEALLVSHRGGVPEVVDAGKLGDRLQHIAEAVGEMSKGLRDRLAPDEIELAFGVRISGELNWWFIAKASSDASISVKLTWKSHQRQESHAEANMRTDL